MSKPVLRYMNKMHIIRKINTGIQYEPVYRPALGLNFVWLLIVSENMDLLNDQSYVNIGILEP